MDKESQINNKKREDSNNTHYTNNNSSNNNLHVESTSNTSDILQHPELEEEEESECTMSRESKLQNTLSAHSSLYRHSHSPSPQSPIITQTIASSSCLPPSSSSSPLKKKESNVLPRVVESSSVVETSSLTMAASSESLPSTGASASF